MSWDIEKWVGSLEKKALYVCVISAAVAVGGWMAINDHPKGITEALKAVMWIPYIAYIFGLIAMSVALLVFVFQTGRKLWADKEKSAPSKKRKKNETNMVLDHVEHLQKDHLILLLGMLRTRNGRAEQIDNSKLVDEMANYSVVLKETRLYQINAHAHVIKLHAALWDKRKQVEKRVVEKLKQEHETTFDDNQTLKTSIERMGQHEYGGYGFKRVVRIPTLK